MPTERIEAGICELAAHLTAAEAGWLELIAEFDKRKGWQSWGLGSCAHRLSWKCGLAPNAARERVHVAHALTELPEVQKAFSSGRLSYSKVRAITRVATADTETTLVYLAQHATASQMERIVRAWRRCLEPNELDRAERQREQRKLRWGSNDDGCVVGSFCLPPEEGNILMKAIEARVAPPPTKTIPRRVRRAMRRRDKDRCVFPGCETSGWVEAHHLVHRADGGSHELRNLATLCKRHHHLVHEGGYRIETRDGAVSFEFFRPDGKPIPPTGEATQGSHAALIHRKRPNGFGTESLGTDSLDTVGRHRRADGPRAHHLGHVHKSSQRPKRFRGNVCGHRVKASVTQRR